MAGAFKITMIRRVQIVKILLCILVQIISVCLFTADAFAYLDPGTGSYVLQMVLAGIAAALFAVKLFWVRIKAFFYSIAGRSKKDD